MKYSMILAVSLIFFIAVTSCKTQPSAVITLDQNQYEQKVVLAQWSFNKELFGGEMNNFDFIRTAKKMGFVGVEYVNQFFLDKAEDAVFLDSLKNTADEIGIRNTLLMIDRAGNLGASDAEERAIAVSEHKKWILAAKRLGCPNIRVNAHGDGTRDDIFAACRSSISELASWGKQHNVGILIENHGSYSSDGDWLKMLVDDLKVDGVASLADFDNWCIERENGELWGAPCIKEYDRYQGIGLLLPTAKSVSIKAFDFDKDGMPIKTDFLKMFELIRESGYEGYLAVEFEGHNIDAKEGVQKVANLIKKLYYLND